MEPLQKFVSTPISDILEACDGNCCPEAVKSAALKLFKAAASRVPAYNMFLTENSIEADSVIDFRDFQEMVPIIEKKNYLHKFPLPQRCIGGSLGSMDFIHVSSGSTGTPTFWARSLGSEVAVAARFEQILVDAFQADTQSTLAVVVFPLGSWVGGLFTTFCLRYVCLKGHPITVITPGDKVPEIIRCVQALAPLFKRTCILGYPPFVKGLIDNGRCQGVPWESYNLSLILAGEVFSEEWRNLVAQRAGIPRPWRDIVSIYGTADAGVIGNETPLSALIRTWLANRPELARKVFDSDRLPTLLQYDPNVRLLELTSQGTIVLTILDSSPALSDLQCGPPLLRYHIEDKGGLISFTEMMDLLAHSGYDPSLEARMADVKIRRMPFCWVFGRAHWAVSLYGANVFVDQVMVGLEQSHIASCVSGKFILSVAHDSDSNPTVHLDVELVPVPSGDEVTADEIERRRLAIALSVKEQLLRLNSEYANYVPADRQLPIVDLWPHGDPSRFPVGVKHKWTN